MIVDKYEYSRYDIGIHYRSDFSLPNDIIGKSVITFGADISSSVHIDNKGKDIKWETRIR